MNEYEKKHLENKNSVIKCLEKSEQFFEKYGYEHELKICKHQVESVKNGEFTIVLVGEFSSGKSTLLNALMGDKLLPSFSNETTATINFLKHKNKSQHGEGGRVYYKDGTEKEIEVADFETISKYVSTESDENVAQTISHLDLYLDSKFLENNVTLVDSPGLNGIADGHREITEEQIQKSSASIFVFNANQPGSNSDFEFLKNLQKHVKGIICVLNQIDCIKETEGQSVESVIKKLKENYKKMIPDAVTIPEIIPVAAYPALVARGTKKMEYNGKVEFSCNEKKKFEDISRMKIFENRLWKYLTQGEKTIQELSAPLKQLEAFFINIKENNKNEFEVLQGKSDVNDLEEQKIELENQLNNLSELLTEKTRDINIELITAESELKEEINSESENLKDRYARKLDMWEEIEDIDTNRIQTDIEKALNKIAIEAIENYKESVGKIIIQSGNDVRDVINERLEEKSFHFKVSNKIEKTEVKLGIEKYDEEIKKLNNELEELDMESDSIEDDFLKALEKKNKYEELNERIGNRKKLRDEYEEASSFCIPKAYHYQKDVMEYRDGEGILGKIRDFFVGRKGEKLTKTVIDTKERDEYIAERNSKIQKYNDEIKGLELELEKIDDGDVSSFEFKRKQIEKKKEQKQNDLDALRATFRQRSEKQIVIGLKRQKSAINDFIDDSVFEFIKQFKKELLRMRGTIAEIITDIVSETITKQIENRKKEIEVLQEKMSLAVQDKENSINRLNNELKDLEPLVLEVIELQNIFDNTRPDYIREEEL
ncbi:MAG: dynamin family protein [Clostridium sp.]|jgi:small GTP-binding protein|nr:dynamin family protein [Clostridium sp.]